MQSGQLLHKCPQRGTGRTAWTGVGAAPGGSGPLLKGEVQGRRRTFTCCLSILSSRPGRHFASSLKSRMADTQQIAFKSSQARCTVLSSTHAAQMLHP